MKPDQLTGPETADDVAARMPGWKRSGDGWLTGDDYREDFRPDINVADAVDAAEALGIAIVADQKDVLCYATVARHYRTVVKLDGRTLAEAICQAVCGVAKQLPEVKHEIR